MHTAGSDEQRDGNCYRGARAACSAQPHRGSYPGALNCADQLLPPSLVARTMSVGEELSEFSSTIQPRSVVTNAALMIWVAPTTVFTWLNVAPPADATTMVAA